ncbi:TlpA disulfide reductase family protein [soil metagenome]
MRKRIALVAAVAVALTLAGCSSNDGLSGEVSKGTINYNTDDQATFIKDGSRAAAITFSSTTDAGTPVSSKQYLGAVTVINFWYGDCAPCRTEAPLLESTYTEYRSKGVDFLGVNTRDGAPRSQEFARKYNVTYPSVLDAANGNMLLAFAATKPANATPVTLILDTKGRVAARISGEIDDKTLLTGYLDQLLSEES